MKRELTYNKWAKYIHDYQLKKSKKMDNITYDDTRDIAINLVAELQSLGHIKSDKEIDKDNDEGINYFEIQDTIQDAINKKLGLDIDDNFEIKITKNI